jgi:hypothetical protein
MFKIKISKIKLFLKNNIRLQVFTNKKNITKKIIK